MRVVVLGGAGFIGSHLVDRLLGAGHDVVAVDSLLGWEPRVPLEQGLRATVEWFRRELASR